MTLIFLILNTLNFASAEVLQLTPQFVVDKVLEQGLQKKQIELKAQKSEIQIGQAESVFDSGMSFASGYSVDQSENFSGMSNNEDRTLVNNITYSKKFSTGTTLSASLEQMQQTSVLSAFASGMRPESQNLNKTTVKISQSLLNNAFGVVDRNKLKMANLNVESAYLSSEEELEDLVLQTLNLYWDTFVAREALREAIEARKLIKDLVRTVSKKSKMGNAAPGELPRIQAELEFQKQRVKQASVNYLNSIQGLKGAMNVPLATQAELSVDEKLPPVPEKVDYKVEQNRTILVTDKAIEATEFTLDNSRSLSRPELNFDFEYNTTGVDEDGDVSFSEMTSSTKPYYYAGLSLRFYLNSSLTEATIVNNKVQLEAAKTSRHQSLTNLQINLDKAYRNIKALHEIAISAKKSVGLREKAAKQMDRAFKQGRLELNTLITGYRELFAEKVTLARANGNYRISLNVYADVRDKLIEPSKISRK